MIGFDNNRYLEEQTKEILNRVQMFNHKLYLEFGGKLMNDFHASRVLPGYDPNVKMRLLQKLKDKAEIILCIHAGDIERRKIRADFGITYDMDILRQIDELNNWGLNVAGVVITRYKNQPAATLFKRRLERRNIKAYIHYYTKGYPFDINRVVSDEGFGMNDYIKTTKPLIIVTGPGPGSGKLATCLSQMYHDNKLGIKAGYAKFETFPIWDLPLKHPINVAYEAATADIRDLNLIDPFHLEAYGKTAVNYNRDVESFPIVKRLLERISGGESIYKSPTDMGVNKVSHGIIDDELVKTASKQEIIRRYFWYKCEYAKGQLDQETIQRMDVLMEDFNLSPEDRKVVNAAREILKHKPNGDNDILCGAAIELKTGDIVTGKSSKLMNATSSLILNAIKVISGIPDNIHLLSPNVIESIKTLKRVNLGEKNPTLCLEETLIALSISATTNPTAQLALSNFNELMGCEMHSTHMLTHTDEAILRKLMVHVTCDPKFPTQNLYNSL